MGGIDPSGVVQFFMDWVGNEGVDINWNVSPGSSPVTVLSHRGEFNKVLCKHVGLSIGFPQETPARLEQHVEATAGDKLAKTLRGGGGSTQWKFGKRCATEAFKT